MASASNVSVNQPLTLVLMGRTGNGKSATGNSILGRKAFHSTPSFESVTKESKMEQCTCEDGRVLNVIDTPDLFDKNASKEFLQKEAFKCFELAKDGTHGVLYVLSIKSRFTEQEADVLDSLQQELGAEILNYMVIVFTGGDVLESDGLTLQDYLNEIPQKLKRMINLCNSRMILFNNHQSALANVKETQIGKLLEQVDSIVADNGGRPYSKELFLKAQTTINLCNSRMVLFNNHQSASANVKETQITELLQQVDSIGADNGGRPYSNDLFLKAQEMSSQLYHVKDKEKQNIEQYVKEQTKLLNETMIKNALAIRETLQGAKAENERDFSVEAKIKELEYEVQNHKKWVVKVESKLEKLDQKMWGASCIIM